ncbi:hypothetical protein BGZ58_002501 [Dissophora ornata]|nr:hypothetical protein BGZ58_002501 [Dissophora ornata]
MPENSGHAPVEGVELPIFEPSKIKAPFLEQFPYGWSDRWTASEATKLSGNGDIFSYIGKWAAEEPHLYPGMSGDFGLVAKTSAAHHAVSASLPEVIDNTGKTLVVQYEVKAQNGLICGGAYMKLLSDSLEGIKFKAFSDETPYTIMFGPDKCGLTDKVHFIFRHKNPITGVYEEKHLNPAPLSKVSQITSLYTLIVRPDQTFEIKINGEVESSGSLLENFVPAVNPAEVIDDTKDKKPANWVEEATIPDPKAKKPEDWDENAPPTILDENATKPADWLEDEQSEIPDPKAVKPEDWDDEEDGDWIPPSVPNPKCQNNGCDKWIRPFISNPEYKGKWSAPMIDNPDYKGVWAPRKIQNPDYFEDLNPSNFEKIGAIGFEIWTMQNDILFDNIYIGHSVEDAEALAEETWKVKYPNEKKLEALANPTPPESLSDDGSMTFSEDPLGFILQHLREFIVLAREDPMDAIHTRPLVVSVLAGVVGVSFGLMLIVLGLMSGVPESTTDSAVAEQVAQTKKTDASSADDGEESVTNSREGGSKSEEEPVLRKRTGALADDEE